MPTVNNPAIGYITCPHCGNSAATVHEFRKGQKLRYYRCKASAAQSCGAIQITGASGQAWIEANMRPEPGEAAAPDRGQPAAADPETPAPPAPAPAAPAELHTAPEQAPAAPASNRVNLTAFLNNLFTE